MSLSSKAKNKNYCPRGVLGSYWPSFSLVAHGPPVFQLVQLSVIADPTNGLLVWDHLLRLSASVCQRMMTEGGTPHNRRAWRLILTRHTTELQESQQALKSAANFCHVLARCRKSNHGISLKRL